MQLPCALHLQAEVTSHGLCPLALVFYLYHDCCDIRIDVVQDLFVSVTADSGLFTSLD
jgi:hypothetical protein